MRRYDYEDGDDADKFFGDMNEDVSDEEYQQWLNDQQETQRAALDVVHRQMEDRFLFRIVKMLEKGFWWRFYSLNKRLRLINETYQAMRSINTPKEE